VICHRRERRRPSSSVTTAAPRGRRRKLGRESLPQNETIWTAYDTPADLVRLSLGILVCAWLLYQLFQLPKDAGSFRTWFYLGLVAVPFAVIVQFVAW
jgi:hypothetical protein